MLTGESLKLQPQVTEAPSSLVRLLSVFERHSMFRWAPAHTGLMHIFCQWKNSVLEFPQSLLTSYHGSTETPPPEHATLPVTQMMGAPQLLRKKSTKSGCTEPQCWASLAHHAASNSQGVLAVVARDTQEDEQLYRGSSPHQAALSAANGLHPC